ncbi:hypothetical protein [Candidatus Borreliella tachyglossi]|uniref:hypothetical protein n=1 Tax=Candidatus Borreliella tachyglossi TaxID=1964448 RepID=UPI0040433D77
MIKIANDFSKAVKEMADELHNKALLKGLEDNPTIKEMYAKINVALNEIKVELPAKTSDSPAINSRIDSLRNAYNNLLKPHYESLQGVTAYRAVSPQ